MINDLILLSGNDIPIQEIQVIIHPPSIKEIALIGEDVFFMGCEFLRFKKDNLSAEDRSRLEHMSNFEIIMSIMRENNSVIKKNVENVIMALSLLFPQYEVDIRPAEMRIILKQNDKEFFIDKNNYDFFKQHLDAILNTKEDSEEYNPSGKMAQAIAEKLKNRRNQLAQKNNNEDKKISILSKYVSILAVGEKKDMNLLLNYTIYQLFEEFKRFQAKMAYDINIKARFAGASDLKEEPKDWMGDLFSEDDKSKEKIDLEA